MRHIAYLLLLAACLIATLPLEFVLGTRVYARWHRLLGALLPTLVVFGLWDVWAIDTHTWRYDKAFLVGVTLPGRLPLEEMLFFVVVPTCAILTLEAVRVCRPGWLIGDEA